MRNLVETGFDVALYDPLISLGCEQAHLGHRVVCPAIGAKPVGAREKVRLKDRLQHQLQGCLGHPVPDGRNPQTTQLPARLGNHPLPYRQRREAAVLELRPQLIEEPLDTLPDLDGTGGTPVHPGRAGTLVAPHPIPRHQQEGGIGDEVEQIVEPAMRIITGPTVQLGLELQYPLLRLHQPKLWFVGIPRQDPPPIRASLTADLLAPLALRPAFPASTAGRDARDYCGASAPPTAISRQRTCPPPDWLSGSRAAVGGSHVHHAIDRSGRRPALLRRHRHAYAAALQRGLPTGTGNPASELTPPRSGVTHRTPTHIHQI